MSAVFVHGVPVHAIDNEPALHQERGRSHMWSRQTGPGAGLEIGLGFLCELKS